MKKFILGLCAAIPALAFAQNAQTFTIKGKVGKITAPAQVFMAYRLGANNVTDSAKVVNGAFTFNGTVTNPVNATLFVDYKGVGFEKFVQQNFAGGTPAAGTDFLSFYIDKGAINIASADSLKKATITGSKINEDDARLKAQLKPIMDKALVLSAEAQKATDAQKQSAAFQNNMQTRYKTLQDEQRKILKSYINDNPSSFLSLLALSSVAGPSPDVAEVEPLYNSLAPELRATDQGREIKFAIDNLKLTAIGSVAPDFTQDDVNGKPVRLSSFRGKYVLLDFWASWCGPCRQENPNVVRTYNKYRNKNFTVLGVSLDRESGRDAWLAAIKQDGLTWTQVSDLKFWNNLVATLYGVRSIPQNFLLDPEGKIIAKGLRGDELGAKLEQLLGKI